MTKIKLKRSAALNLHMALTVCRALDVPFKFRYVIGRNLASTGVEFEASTKAYPEPQLAEPVSDATRAAHAAWSTAWAAHLDEDIELSAYTVHLCDVPDIDDRSIADDARRAMQNQAIADALSHIIVD